ncbi:beta-N-acetylhexosaminidase [Paenibacillus anaericanus]|uniref:Beta-N-acetylhexosaminidase n=1 Tax=Paenibacillus anaericanus TaxID=170367 RepID=A0A433XX45_9BACL|nr:beta-N-acetylhexosaminidase [Paenibacillus anaericanus]RUT39315.1 beta-N-acetylhexosaminidase [Paenibacillus anaericanus]
MNITITGLNDLHLLAVSQVAQLLDIQLDDVGFPMHIEQTGTGIHIRNDDSQGCITYGEAHQLIRAIGLWRERIKQEVVFDIHELPAYDSLGVMVDCSRNAVLHAQAYQELVRRLALMGYSTIQMYTEDTYELKDYPYFGYMRGRYTGEELREMDRYAAMFGIELVPCIQTLAHLGTTLRWQEHAHLVDCNDILLIDDPHTYELIEEMFATMSENLTSRNINIGMDEAHMMGLGKYLDKHGYQDRSKLMLRHFGKVMEIARRYGYKPMMWSDMFFRLASSGEYYDADSQIRTDIVEMIPEDISLVYWDYYSEEQAKYDAMLKKHKQLSDKIVFAGGAWKWMGFTPNNQFSHHIGVMAHNSCVENGIKDVLVTGWGDNGAENSLFAILPSLQLWAELSYTNRSDEEHLSKRFMTCTGGVYDDFMNLDIAGLVPDNPAPGGSSVNPPKYLLYQDILCGLFDKHVIPEIYAEHYRQAAPMLKEAGERNLQWKMVFETQYALCLLLELKVDAGINLRNAYLNGDRTTLKRYAHEILPELKSRAVRFISAYRAQWMSENKIFGLDVFDLRMGGLMQRLESTSWRLDMYLNGVIPNLEELEQERLYFDGRKEDGTTVAMSANLWHTIATTSVIAGV